MNAIEALKQNVLSMQLNLVSLRDLLLLKIPQNDVYIFQGERFEVIVAEGTPIDRDILKKLFIKGIRHVFVHHQDYHLIKDNLKNELLKITRSLSIGDARDKGKKHINYLSMNFSELYKDPMNDELLKIQHQSTVNLGKFMMGNKGILNDLFEDLASQNHHYVIGQPLLSSILLIGFLNQFKLFHDKDIEALFITSYFKDIGMSFVPDDKLDKRSLSGDEKKVFGKHTENSLHLLDGRLPFNRSHLDIIRNHHFMNKRIKAVINGEKYQEDDSDLIVGLETTLVAVMDILVAMISDRPYRKKYTLYKALELIRDLMADEYPTEFKAIVTYLKYFFEKK